MSNQLLEELEEPALEKEDEETEIKKRDEEQTQEADNDGEESKGENPLQKYMKMVLEAREKQHEEVSVSCITSGTGLDLCVCVKASVCPWFQSPGGGEAAHASLSEEKDNR